MIKKEILIGILIAIFLIGDAWAFGVSSPVWKGNPLSVSPGEEKTVELVLRNMVGGEGDERVKVVLTQGNDIAEITEEDYIVPFGTKDTKVPIKVSVPKETPLGTGYVVTVSFLSVPENRGGAAALGTGVDTTFDVLVVPEPQAQLAPEEGVNYNLVWIILGIVILIVIIWFVLKGKKKNIRKK